MIQKDRIKRKRLGVVLGFIFAFALFMGAGPGIYLVNPDTIDPGAKCATVFGGVPIIYAWVILWYMVEALVAIVAYFHLWNDE